MSFRAISRGGSNFINLMDPSGFCTSFVRWKQKSHSFWLKITIKLVLVLSCLCYIQTILYTNLAVKQINCAIEVACICCIDITQCKDDVFQFIYTPQEKEEYFLHVQKLRAGWGGWGHSGDFSKIWYTFHFSHLRCVAHKKSECSARLHIYYHLSAGGIISVATEGNIDKWISSLFLKV